MAKIDLARRAEIGQLKRARTRAQLIAAANALFSRHAVESVTVDDVVSEAGVAKGTFYVHFEDLNALTAAVADDLIGRLDEMLQPQRRSIPDPLMRIAFGCNSFIAQAFADPAWATVVARMASSQPSVGQGARSRLREDLQQVFAQAAPEGVSLELALEVVIGILLQVLIACGQGRLSPADRPGAVGSILRAIGVARPQIRAVLARLPQDRVAPSVAGEPPARARKPATARR